MIPDLAVPAARVQVEFTERKSVFLATLDRVRDEGDYRALVDELRTSHRDARHHCSAFVAGDFRDVQRSSDDGEPAGTAGMPILEVLNRATAHDLPLGELAVVVTRWFGGVKLGAGGLTRAYSESASRAVDAARWLRHTRRVHLTWAVSHADAARLENGLRHHDVEVTEVSYTATGAHLHLAIAEGDAARADLLARCESLAQASVELVPGETTWVDLPLG